MWKISIFFICDFFSYEFISVTFFSDFFSCDFEVFPITVYLPSYSIIPGLVTNGTAKICCRGLILALFYSTMVIKNDFG